MLQRALSHVATLFEEVLLSASGPRKETALHPSSQEMASKHYCPVCRQMFEDIFDLTSHARTHNGPARSYSRARKAPKSPALFGDTGHQTEVYRQTEDTFTLKPNGHSGKQVPDVFESTSTADSHSGHKKENLMQDTVTVKEDTKDRCNEKGVSPEAAQMGLYKDHQIKDELVLGPVLLQPRDVASIVQNNNEKEPTSTADSPTANDEESVSQDSVTVKVEPEERCFDEGVTEAISGSGLLECPIKDELVRYERCIEESVSPEGAEIGFYKDHQIKDELVLRPNLLQAPDVALIVHRNNEQERSTVDSFITNSNDTVTVKVDPEERCFDEGETEAVAVDHLEHPLKCNHCDYATSFEILLCQHLMTHTGDKSDHTGDKSDHHGDAGRNGQLTVHNRTHTGVKHFKCSVCVYTTHTRQLLRQHKRRHMSYKPFKCSHCNYRSFYKGDVTKHELIHNEALECSYCCYTCYSKQALARHNLQHHSEKSFKCSHCNYRSFYKGDVTRHELIHNEPLECSYCCYTCYSEQALAGHKLRHHSEKSFKCSHCNYRSRFKSNVTRHELIHNEPLE